MTKIPSGSSRDPTEGVVGWLQTPPREVAGLRELFDHRLCKTDD
jgi:hypothetical protein